MTTPRAAILGIIGACALMAAMSAADTRLVTTVHGDPLPWSIILQSTLPRWVLFAVALPVLLSATLRRPPWPLAPRTFVMHAAMFAGLTLAHAVVHGIAIGAAIPLSGGFGFALRAIRVWVSSAPVIVPLYSATLLTAWSIEQMRERRLRALRASQLEAQLKSAQLAALRAQLNPHFLYNSLNGISALVADRQHERASGALEQLAELLHAAFRDDGRELIPLSEEVALAAQYLELQQMRFGDRLLCRVSIDPGAATAVVPPLILQPLVENAVLHGLANRSGAMRLTISAHEQDARVAVSVSHDGPELPAAWRPESVGGVGLANTRARLATAFGEAGTLSVSRRVGGGVESLVTVPA